MVESTRLLGPLVHKLGQWEPLGAADKEALLALPAQIATLSPQQYIVREGDRARHSCLMLSGFTYRQKTAAKGGRQIMSIHMKGDLPDLQNSLLRVADHNLQALTAVEVALIPVAAIKEIVFAKPAVGRAMWYETLVDGSIFREWMLNIGRRDAITRTAHTICEFAVRLEKAGLGERTDFELPMTQEQFADALSLTPIHLNRMLMRLEREGALSRTMRLVRIADWKRLAVVGEFDEAYLHLPSDS